MRYEKGHRAASRQRIIEVAARRFRGDGIAASGLSGIMQAAGLTNGAFYPHFSSKADLVAACVESALEAQSDRVRQGLGAGGLDAVLDFYLSPEHRDDPASGCPSAALLPELARQPRETRAVYERHLQVMVDLIAASLPHLTAEPQQVALGVCSILMGSLQLARAVADPQASDSILAAGKTAARVLVVAGLRAGS